MIVEQKEWNESHNWISNNDKDLSEKAELVLAFGCKKSLSDPNRYKEISQFYPNANIVLCSTAGEIIDNRVVDECIILTAMSFDSTSILIEKVKISDPEETSKAGEQIIDALKKEDLAYMLVISDWGVVNGSELVKVFNQKDTEHTIVSGGMAGDGPDFNSTLTGLNETPTGENIIGIGFYGKNLKVGHAAKGGWDPFGPERVITKSKNNILYELDGHSVVDLYKKYLGELSEDLGASALLFPLGIKLTKSSEPLVRTVLGIDEENNNMIFAGDMPEGATVRMMKSNFEKLIDAASTAATTSVDEFGSFNPDLAILVSCAGRKFVLQDRVEEEVQKIHEVLGENTAISGFYSYGEISPVVKDTACQLHNQTMTITTLKEVV